MERRKWISNQLMFWDTGEWNSAYAACEAQDPNFEQLSGTEQVQYMVGWLMKERPVSLEQLEERKARLR